jgi:gliding motility-associated-like protein
MPDEFTMSCNGVSGNLLSDNGSGKDYDPEKEQIYLELTLIRNPSHGRVTLNPDQSGTFDYVVTAGYSGIDTFRYVISDIKQNISKPALVTIHIIADFDGDGIPDDIDQDADGDGILNVDEVLPGENWKTADSDGDGHPNWLDIDSDNDGIVDNIEAQNGNGPNSIEDPGNPEYTLPTGKVNEFGVDYAYDPGHGGQKLVPVDTDGDGIPDFLDTDSDGDGVPDYIEGNDANHDGHPDYVLTGKDSDGDGLDDGFDILDRCADAATNMTGAGSRSPLQDNDNDGMRDWRDVNDDNDKWLTAYEDWNGDGIWWNDDSNHNGIPDYLDPLTDCELFIPDAFSPNGDNIHDYFNIYCMQNYPHARMYIFDQLGNKLYEKQDYGNLDTWKTPDKAWWDGRTTNRKYATSTGMVEPGTYFYVLQLGNGEVKKSYVFVSY